MRLERRANEFFPIGWKLALHVCLDPTIKVRCKTRFATEAAQSSQDFSQPCHCLQFRDLGADSLSASPPLYLKLILLALASDFFVDDSAPRRQHRGFSACVPPTITHQSGFGFELGEPQEKYRNVSAIRKCFGLAFPLLVRDHLAG